MNSAEQISGRLEEFLEKRTEGMNEISAYSYRAGYCQETINQILMRSPEARLILSTFLDDTQFLLQK